MAIGPLVVAGNIDEGVIGVLKPLLFAEEYLVGARRATTFDVADVDDEDQRLAVQLSKENLGLALLLDVVRGVPYETDLECRHTRVTLIRGSLLQFGKYDVEPEDD
jgi:hypothetical protein